MKWLVIIIAWGANDIVAPLRYRTTLMTLSAVAVLSCAVVCTRHQLGYWQNDFTLSEHTLEVTQDNAIIHNNYGVVLHDAGRLDEALIHLEKAVEIIPTFSKARYNLAMLHLEQGRLDEAIASFQELLKTDKNSAEAYYYLAVAYTKKMSKIRL